MTDYIWFTRINLTTFRSQFNGLAYKEYGHDWGGEHDGGVANGDIFLPIASQRQEKCMRGITLEREEMTEKSYVFDPSKFNKQKDMLYIQHQIAARGKFAELLQQHDLGVGGELVPYTIYEKDRVTPLPDQYYLFNFGERKDCFVPEESKNLDILRKKERDGEDLWKASLLGVDDDLAFTTAALEGADIWFDKHIHSHFFMSDRLVKAIKAAKLGIPFKFVRCRILPIH